MNQYIHFRFLARTLLVVLATGGLATFQANGQANYRFQQEYFFGRMPSAQIEAMGGADVAVGGSGPSLFFNPAGIGLVANQEVTLNISAPFYALVNSNYTFLSYVRRVNDRLVGAVSVNRFSMGESSFTVDIAGGDYPVETPVINNFAATGAFSVTGAVQAGVNLNVFRWKLFDDVSASSAFLGDVGATWTKELASSSNTPATLRVGASVTNLTFSSITFSAADGAEASAEFPAVARVGVSYAVHREVSVRGAGDMPVALLATFEVQDVLNNEFRTGVRFGVEGRFYEVLSIRLGAFTHKLDDFDVANNKSTLSDITYGFGIAIPVSRFTGGKLPADVHVDYVSLKQPPYVESGRRLANMRGFTFRLVWL